MPTRPRASSAPEPVHAAVLGDRGVFIWQKALHVAGNALPEPVRYSLTVLALYMNPDGTHGRPGFERFALARGKTDRTLRTHLDQAINAGWLVCTQRGGRNGDGTTRASVYVATFPAEVYARLAGLLTPAWGDCGLPQPEAEALPVEADPQPATHGLPVETVSTGNLDASTGNPGVSTGSAGLPPTDQFHRPDTPISQSARVRAVLEGLGWQGMTDFVVGHVIAEGMRRAATTGKPLQVPVERYLTSWKREDLVEAIGQAYAAEDARNRPAEPGSAPWPARGGTQARTVSEAIADATPDARPAPARPEHHPDSPVPDNVTRMGARRPECPHGHSGGAYPRPGDGLPSCGPCRAHTLACHRAPGTCLTCRGIADARPGERISETA